MAKTARSAVELEAELARAREQQAASRQILEAIGRARGDVGPVMREIAEAALRLCRADHATVFTREGDDYVSRAHVGTPADLRSPDDLAHPGVVGLALQERATQHTADYYTDPRFAPPQFTGRTDFSPTRLVVPIVVDGDARLVVASQGLHAERFVVGERQPIAFKSMFGRTIREKRLIHHADARTLDVSDRDKWLTRLTVPIMKDDEPIGVLGLSREAAGGFSGPELELVKTFAQQAGIAIANVRLFNETKESLEQQKAMSDVLAAIGRATSDVRPVFETILEHAGRLCDADRATIALREDDAVMVKAGWNMPQAAMDDYTREPYAVDRTSAVGRTILEGRTLTWDDMTLDTEISARAQTTRGISGARSVLTVPLLREGVAIGAINLRRTEVRPFTRREATLVETFAEQATLAIENVRLFNETREALKQQSAVAGVLASIRSSAFDLDSR